MVLSIIPPLGRAYSSLLGAVTTRTALLAMGYWWLPSPEVVTLRRGKGMANARTNSAINPKQGDLIVANWTSYVDLIWLTFK